MKRFYLRIIEFDGTNDLWLKQSTETIGIVTDTEIDSVVESFPTSISQSLNIKESTSTISTISIKCANKDTELSGILFNDFYGEDNLYDSKCELGYYDSSTPAVKTVIYTGILDNISNDVYETWYSFNLKDSLEKLKETTLISTTTGKDIFAIDTPLSELPNTPTAGAFDRLGRKESAGTTSGFLSNYLDTTSQATFDAWSEEKWVVLTYTGHPIDLAKFLLSELGVEYDNTSFEEVRDDAKNTTIGSFYYEWKEPIKNTFEFITKQILKPLNAYPVIKSDGKLYITTLKQPRVVNPPTILDDSNIIRITKNTITRKDIINHIFVNSDHNTEKDEYITQVYDIDNIDAEGNDSISAFGYSPKSAGSIDVIGLNSKSTIDGTTDLQERIVFSQSLASYIFSRFGLTTRVIELEANKTVSDSLSIADVVVVSETKIIQWKGTEKGTRGLPTLDTATYAIIGESYWGEYVDIWEDNDFLSDAYVPSGIRVSELIDEDFFYDILQNYYLDIAFLAQHNRL